MPETPITRIAQTNQKPINPDGDYILYWMIANRRPNWNFSLDRALEWSVRLKKPVLTLEALRCGQKWACDRFHSFVLDGMRANKIAFNKSNVAYYPYLETDQNSGKGLIEELSKKACLIVADDFPCFFLPKMVKSAENKSRVMLEKVDSNGLIPISMTHKIFPSAYSFRRYVQNVLPKIILERPNPHPLNDVPFFGLARIDKSVEERWPQVTEVQLSSEAKDIPKLPIDHKIKPVSLRGGFMRAYDVMEKFFSEKLALYGELRNVPDKNVTSGLSVFLHWGHVAAHEVFWSLMDKENWTPDQLGNKSTGKRSGWWGCSPNTESFLDELIVWRELGYNMCALSENYDQYFSLPDWAINTLRDHENDVRQHIYTLEQFENARTHDPLWNAAQIELVREGRIHNYLRMLWGKKILEWTPNPQEALKIMVELNNKYALDGRNPNSYSGIFWILGRYDRPWGPERKIFGKIRYMSSDRTREKVSVKKYLEKYQHNE